MCEVEDVPEHIVTRILDCFEELFSVVRRTGAPEDNLIIMLKSSNKLSEIWPKAHINRKIIMLESGIYSGQIIIEN